MGWIILLLGVLAFWIIIWVIRFVWNRGKDVVRTGAEYQRVKALEKDGYLDGHYGRTIRRQKLAAFIVSLLIFVAVVVFILL